MRYAVVGMLCLVAGAVAGYIFAPRNHISEDRELYLTHEAFSRQAELSWKILQGLDADPPQLEKLQKTARAHISVYLDEVASLKSQGASWVPLIDRENFEEMKKYIRSHPLSQANGHNHRLQLTGDARDR